MLVDLVNRFGRAAGNINVPDDIVQAAQRVEKWMVENNVREFYGLMVMSLASHPARYQKTEDND